MIICTDLKPQINCQPDRILDAVKCFNVNLFKMYVIVCDSVLLLLTRQILLQIPELIILITGMMLGIFFYLVVKT